ncbi:hypothetical protein ABZY58_06995 [Micromonospora tulbaghiae]|uniref:hypothetical protein n=1 Tax=Micromonospora tulbaghiae TaxID=479978 RepID=UPI0033B1AFFA
MSPAEMVVTAQEALVRWLPAGFESQLRESLPAPPWQIQPCTPMQDRPTDAAREAAGLSASWAHQHGRAGGTERETKEAELAAYLAEDLNPVDTDHDHDEDEDDDEDLDDAEVFVEAKTARFLAALDLPVPDDLPR